MNQLQNNHLNFQEKANVNFFTPPSPQEKKTVDQNFIQTFFSSLKERVAKTQWNFKKIGIISLGAAATIGTFFAVRRLAQSYGTSPQNFGGSDARAQHLPPKNSNTPINLKDFEITQWHSPLLWLDRCPSGLKINPIAYPEINQDTNPFKPKIVEEIPEKNETEEEFLKQEEQPQEFLNLLPENEEKPQPSQATQSFIPWFLKGAVKLYFCSLGILAAGVVLDGQTTKLYAKKLMKSPICPAITMHSEKKSRLDIQKKLNLYDLKLNPIEDEIPTDDRNYAEYHDNDLQLKDDIRYQNIEVTRTLNGGANEKHYSLQGGMFKHCSQYDAQNPINSEIKEQEWLLYLPGNSEPFQYIIKKLHGISKKNKINVVCANYSGVDDIEKAPSSPLELGNDAFATLKSLKEKGVDLKKICVYGFSLGGSAAMMLLEKCENNPELRGKVRFIFDRSFSSLVDVVLTPYNKSPVVSKVCAIVSKLVAKAVGINLSSREILKRVLNKEAKLSTQEKSDDYIYIKDRIRIFNSPVDEVICSGGQLIDDLSPELKESTIKIDLGHGDDPGVHQGKYTSAISTLLNRKDLSLKDLIDNAVNQEQVDEIVNHYYDLDMHPVDKFLDLDIVPKKKEWIKNSLKTFFDSVVVSLSETLIKSPSLTREKLTFLLNIQEIFLGKKIIEIPTNTVEALVSSMVQKQVEGFTGIYKKNLSKKFNDFLNDWLLFKKEIEDLNFKLTKSLNEILESEENLPWLFKSFISELYPLKNPYIFDRLEQLFPNKAPNIVEKNPLFSEIWKSVIKSRLVGAIKSAEITLSEDLKISSTNYLQEQVPQIVKDYGLAELWNKTIEIKKSAIIHKKPLTAVPLNKNPVIGSMNLSDLDLGFFGNEDVQEKPIDKNVSNTQSDQIEILNNYNENLDNYFKEKSNLNKFLSLNENKLVELPKAINKNNNTQQPQNNENFPNDKESSMVFQNNQF